MCLPACWANAQQPRRFVSWMSSQTSSVISSQAMNGLIAALLTAISMPPGPAATESTIARTAAGSRMSAAYAVASPPAAATASSVGCGSWPGLWAANTCAPSLASRTAMAWPMPVADPVTIARFPVNRGMQLL
jgi:hypothetical protein